MARSKPSRKKSPPLLAAVPASGADDSARVRIAEGLLEGLSADEVVAKMVLGGMPGATARYEVDRALKSPYYKAAAQVRGRIAKRDWTLGIYAKHAEMADDRVVPVVDRIAPERFFRDFYCANRPVILTGLVDDWPARTKWSIDWIEGQLGDREIGVQWDREANDNYESQSPDHKRRMRLADVIARMRAGASNDFYITANNSDLNKTVLAPLWDDIGAIPGILEKKEERDGFFWMGPKGTITPFHHDLTNNLLMQCVGRKKVKLVAPYYTPLMKNRLHCYSQWRGDELPEGPAGEGRPAVIECTIGPGDVLFLPVGWWHHVEGLDITIGMSFINFVWPNDFYSDYRSYDAV